MNILVTGGTGFTGSNLVKRLVSKGHAVTSYDVKPGIADDELRALGVALVYGDICNREAVRACVQNAEIVFHVAAAFRGHNLPDKVYWDTNVEGTRIIAEESLKCNIQRFIYCSTEGVHGRVEHPPIDENGPIAPKDLYQVTKYEGEKVVNEIKAKGLRTVIIRPTGIYGPGDPGRFLMLFKQAKTGFFPMFGSGKITYHPVFIDNLVDAFELAMQKPEALGQVYIIGDAKYASLIELVKEVAHAMDKKIKFIFCPYSILFVASCVCEWICKPFNIPPPLFRRRAEWYWENRGFSIEKARRELGYTAAIPLDKGLRLTKEWYERNGYI